MNLSDHYLHDEQEILRKSTELVSKYHVDKAMEKFYRKANAHNHTNSRKNDLLILIDTSALLETPCSKIFIHNIAPALMKRGEKIVIPMSVICELQNLAEHSGSRDVSQRAKDMFAFVLDYWRQGVINIYDNEAGGIFADELLQILTITFARLYRVIVISQDYFLGQDLLTISKLPSVKGRSISVRKLNSNGELLKVEWNGASYLQQT